VALQRLQWLVKEMVKEKRKETKQRHSLYRRALELVGLRVSDSTQVVETEDGAFVETAIFVPKENLIMEQTIQITDKAIIINIASPHAVTALAAVAESVQHTDPNLCNFLWSAVHVIKMKLAR
jgi:hypothetical protein